MNTVIKEFRLLAVLLYKAFVIICVNAGLVQCLSESISVVYRAANGKDLEDLKKIQQKVEVAASALCLIFPSSSPFLFSFFSYFCLGQFTEYYRVVWVERDLKDHPVPTPLPGAGISSNRSSCPGPQPAWPSTLSGMGHP